jgi:hypothetical protein
LALTALSTLLAALTGLIGLALLFWLYIEQHSLEWAVPRDAAETIGCRRWRPKNWPQSSKQLIEMW